jgi:hypothetical protein
MEAQDYANKAYQWAKALRLLDPNIQLVSCGGASALFGFLYTVRQSL